MKALTLWQPWASLCFLEHGDPARLAKQIETRSWPAPASLIGDRIAIHAAARPVPERGPEVLRLGKVRAWTIPGKRSFIGFDDPAELMMTEVPLGAVLGTVVVTACVPMVEAGDHPMSLVRSECVVLSKDRTKAGYYRPNMGPDDRSVGVDDQLPFGIFEPGRWAWLLSEIERFDDPIPAVGRQGLWNWSQP